MIAEEIITSPGFLTEMTCHQGPSIEGLSREKPVLLIFLRHFGCIFCQEALVDISEKRKEMDKDGIATVFVHMSDAQTAEQYFEKFNLEGALHICDPDRKYYQAFGLTKGSFSQLFGLQVWMRGFSAQRSKGLQPRRNKSLGDSFQMPGVFIIQDGEIKEKFIHNLISDRPDYGKLLDCCVK